MWMEILPIMKWKFNIIYGGVKRTIFQYNLSIIQFLTIAKTLSMSDCWFRIWRRYFISSKFKFFPFQQNISVKTLSWIMRSNLILNCIENIYICLTELGISITWSIVGTIELAIALQGNFSLHLDHIYANFMENRPLN